jgi:hypothetical protein
MNSANRFVFKSDGAQYSVLRGGDLDMETIDRLMPKPNGKMACEKLMVVRNLTIGLGSTAVRGIDQLVQVVNEQAGGLHQLPHCSLVAIDTADLIAAHLPETCQLRLLPVGNAELDRCRVSVLTIQRHVLAPLPESASIDGCGGDPISGWATALLRSPQIREKLRSEIARLADPRLRDKIRAGMLADAELAARTLIIDLLLGIAGASGGTLALLVAALVAALAAEVDLLPVIRVTVLPASAYPRGSKANQQTRDKNTALLLSAIQYYRDDSHPLDLSLPDGTEIHTQLKLESVEIVGGSQPLDSVLNDWATAWFYGAASLMGQTERSRAADPIKNISEQRDTGTARGNAGNRCNLGTHAVKVIRAIPEETEQCLPVLLVRRALKAELTETQTSEFQQIAASVLRSWKDARLDPDKLCDDLPRLSSVNAFPVEVDESGVQARRTDKGREVAQIAAIGRYRETLAGLFQDLQKRLTEMPVWLQRHVLQAIVELLSKTLAAVKTAYATWAQQEKSGDRELKSVMEMRPRDRVRADAVHAALDKTLKAAATAQALHNARLLLRQTADNLQTLHERATARRNAIRQVLRGAVDRVRETSPNCVESSLLSNHELANLVPTVRLLALCRQSTGGADASDLSASLYKSAEGLAAAAIAQYGKSFSAAWHALPRPSPTSFLRALFDRLPLGVVLKQGADAVLPLWKIELVGVPNDLYCEWMGLREDKEDIFVNPIRETDCIVIKRATYGISAKWLQDSEAYELALREHCLADPKARVLSLVNDTPLPLFRVLDDAENAELETLGLLLAAPNSSLSVSRHAELCYAPQGKAPVVVAGQDEEWTECWSAAIHDGRLPPVKDLVTEYKRLVEDLSPQQEMDRVEEFIRARLSGQPGWAAWTALRLTTALRNWQQRMSNRWQRPLLASCRG